MRSVVVLGHSDLRTRRRRETKRNSSQSGVAAPEDGAHSGVSLFRQALKQNSGTLRIANPCFPPVITGPVNKLTKGFIMKIQIAIAVFVTGLLAGCATSEYGVAELEAVS